LTAVLDRLATLRTNAADPDGDVRFTLGPDGRLLSFFIDRGGDCANMCADCRYPAKQPFAVGGDEGVDVLEVNRGLGGAHWEAPA
jgi:hypothetical protein